VKPKVVEEVSSGNNNIDMEMTSDQDVSLTGWLDLYPYPLKYLFVDLAI
jgi:hypothetical protein